MLATFIDQKKKRTGQNIVGNNSSRIGTIYISSTMALYMSCLLESGPCVTHHGRKTGNGVRLGSALFSSIFFLLFLQSCSDRYGRLLYLCPHIKHMLLCDQFAFLTSSAMINGVIYFKHEGCFFSAGLPPFVTSHDFLTMMFIETIESAFFAVKLKLVG